MRFSRTDDSPSLSGIAAVARVLHLLLLSLWVGGGLLLAFTVAPSAFEILSSRNEAGLLVQTIISQFDLYGLLAGPTLLFTLVIGWKPIGSPLRFRALSVLAMTAATAISRLYLSPAMVEIQKAMGRPLEDIDPSDPARLEFDTFHTYSEWAMTFHVGVAVIMLVMAASAATPKKRSYGGIEL